MTQKLMFHISGEIEIPNKFLKLIKYLIFDTILSLYVFLRPMHQFQ